MTHIDQYSVQLFRTAEILPFGGRDSFIGFRDLLNRENIADVMHLRQGIARLMNTMLRLWSQTGQV